MKKFLIGLVSFQIILIAALIGMLVHFNVIIFPLLASLVVMMVVQVSLLIFILTTKKYIFKSPFKREG